VRVKLKLKSKVPSSAAGDSVESGVVVVVGTGVVVVGTVESGVVVVVGTGVVVVGKVVVVVGTGVAVVEVVSSGVFLAALTALGRDGAALLVDFDSDSTYITKYKPERQAY
jgi:hypothetical protein